MIARRAIYDIVACIPQGKVATYGQIATLAGSSGQARQVGYALAALPDDVDVPWHRVINAKGEISPRTQTKIHELQRQLLEGEGITFVADKIDLGRFRWQPDCDSQRSGGSQDRSPE